MRRVTTILLVLLMLPAYTTSATEEPFNFFIEQEIVIHPDETIQFRIAWQNIASSERHFTVTTNHSHANISVGDLPTDWTRVASGNLGEMVINLTVAPNSNFETISFSLNFTCQEVPDWDYVHHVDVLVSKWSDLRFGVNDGSEFFVQQNVRTGVSVNLSNFAQYDDMVSLELDSQSNWDYGFDEDSNNDGLLNVELSSGNYQFISFWIDTPPILDGAPLAGTGPSFTLIGESLLDRRTITWNFSLQMQTYHNMTIDYVESNLSIEPGDDKRLKITVRNTGNIETLLDASLEYNSAKLDRFEIENWTIGIFNSFEFQPLQPNESRTIEIGFDAPNRNLGEIGIDLVIMPDSFPQRATKVNISSSIDWKQDGEVSLVGDSCQSVEWNQTCQQFVTIENTGNYYQDYLLEITNTEGMNFEIGSNLIGVTKGQTSAQIPLNMTALENADGFLPASATLNLKLSDGTLIDSVGISTKTAPRIDWKWEDSASSVSGDRLEIVVTMRNDGNIEDGLIVRMTSSYFTEMSFIPPDNAIVEDDTENIRSFEIIDIEKGDNFTFRAWAEIPDDQNSADEFYLNITAHSRLAEDNPFKFSANTTFDAVVSTSDDQESVVSKLGDLISNFFAIIWAWKWIFLATLTSGLMINKSIKDRRARIADKKLMNSQQSIEEKPDDWMAEFATKKQQTPEIPQSPQIPSEVFAGMFQAVGGGRKPVAQPVESELVGAASTVLDHHDNVATKSKLDDLADNIAAGNVSSPHSANIALPDDITPVTQRTIPKSKEENVVPTMLDLDDLDL